MDQSQQFSYENINVLDAKIRQKKAGSQISKTEFNYHQRLDNVALDKEHPGSNPRSSVIYQD